MDYPIYDSKQASQSSIFDGARELADYDRNLKVRGLGASGDKEFGAPNLAVPRDQSIDIGASDFRPASNNPLKAYNDMLDKRADTLLIEGVERSLRYAEEIRADSLRHDEMFKSWRSPSDIRARLEMAEQIRKQEQQERKEHKKGWFKYMPW